MKVLLWGGRSKSRIILEMISELYEHASVIGIFDRTLKEIPFKTDIKHSEKLT